MDIMKLNSEINIGLIFEFEKWLVITWWLHALSAREVTMRGRRRRSIRGGGIL